MQWEPIESAPKDSTVVLLWAESYYPVIGWYDAGKRSWQDVWEHEWRRPKQPTHWMPIPEPPK